MSKKRAFNINETFQEILETAKSIETDKKTGFKTTSNDNTCDNCDYKTYCPKWE
ncbi:MAG: hypothetical protein Q7K42_01855 [Candidatus Diapherotrites archaeon]|nr:hypothetical protein [Candidatus Diapherotrites archaeon]